MECALRKQSFVAEGESVAVSIHAWERAISAAATRTRTKRSGRGSRLHGRRIRHGCIRLLPHLRCCNRTRCICVGIVRSDLRCNREGYQKSTEQQPPAEPSGRSCVRNEPKSTSYSEYRVLGEAGSGHPLQLIAPSASI